MSSLKTTTVITTHNIQRNRYVPFKGTKMKTNKTVHIKGIMADLQEDFKACWIKDAQRTKGGRKENQECDVWTKLNYQ